MINNNYVEDINRATGDYYPNPMIVSLSLPRPLLEQTDALVRERGYRGRSELVRAALREFVKAQRREEAAAGHLNAIVVLGYPEKCERAVTEVRHAHNDLVTSMLHAHTVRGRCATVLLSEGPADKMRRFLAELRGVRDLASIEVTLLE